MTITRNQFDLALLERIRIPEPTTARDRIAAARVL